MGMESPKTAERLMTPTAIIAVGLFLSHREVGFLLPFYQPTRVGGSLRSASCLGNERPPDRRQDYLVPNSRGRFALGPLEGHLLPILAALQLRWIGRHYFGARRLQLRRHSAADPRPGSAASPY